MNSSHKRPHAIYQIQVQGELDRNWEGYFSNMAIKLTHTAGVPITILTGPVIDQSSLRGLLCKLWDLNLILISVRQLKSDRKKE